ncbi:MAG: septum formation initiator family protein [Holosporales bacterium]|nr:septum formation initiator family protein [Holosporales bacterium]
MVSLQKFVHPLLTVLCVGYFSYHLIKGDRGLLAWMQLERKSAEAAQYLAELREKNQALHDKIVHLQNKSLDLDLLGEQAYALELAYPDDVILLVPNYTFGDPF